MDTGIFEILDEMEEYVQNSKKVPITGKILISENLLLDFLDRIRNMLPEEIHRAKLLSKEREQIIQEARVEADRILNSVKEQIDRLACESEVAKQAQNMADEIIANAKRVAKEIKNGATEYADEVLRQLEESINKSLSIVQQARGELDNIHVHK